VNGSTRASSIEDIIEEEAGGETIEPEQEQELINGARRARSLSRPDAIFLLLGTIGAVMVSSF
jgi:hypothetical protein